MYKLISASVLMMILSSCNARPMLTNVNVPQNLSANSARSSQSAVKLVDGFTTVIDKQKVIQKLMNSEVSIEKADVYDTKNVFRIEFSKGQVNGVVGILKMYLRPSGASEMLMVGNYYNNQPLELSQQETAQILKSASNYSRIPELAKILD